MGQPRGLGSGAHAPRSRARGCVGGCGRPEGRRAELSTACAARGLPMTLLSASATPGTGRPPALWMPARRLGGGLRPQGRGSERLGSPPVPLSPAGPAFAAAAATRAGTGPSCSPAAGSSASGPRGLAGPDLRPRGSLLP